MEYHDFIEKVKKELPPQIHYEKLEVCFSGYKKGDPQNEWEVNTTIDYDLDLDEDLIDDYVDSYLDSYLDERHITLEEVDFKNFISLFYDYLTEELEEKAIKEIESDPAYYLED